MLGVNSMQLALIKKDMRSVTSNKRLFSVMLIVPLVMVVAMPTIFALTVAFAPMDSNDMQMFLSMIPGGEGGVGVDGMKALAVDAIINSVMPIFFLLIPIMAASVTAASSFVGEKEKRTLETLLFCPLSLRRIFGAKVIASFTLSMAVSALSFVAMLAVTQVEGWIFLGFAPRMGVIWLVAMLLVSPSLSVIAITLIVRGSAKAQTMEESQQRSVFLILPIVALAVGQVSGLAFMGVWVLLGLGVVFAAAAVALARASFRGFTYERLLN